MMRFACIVLPFVSGCLVNQIMSFGLGAERTSDWYETPAIRKPRAEIASVVRELIVRQGYETPGFDPEAGHIETAWDTHLSPLWREGTRSMIETEIVPTDAGGFIVRVRSSLEVNDNSWSPAMADRAQWVGAGVSDRQKPRIPEPAIKLHASLKLRFFGLNP
jgi:hypothetical protein